MKTTFSVIARYFDRFAGLWLAPGYSVVLHPGRRLVEFLNDKGVALTNELHSPTDDDFAFVKGELDKLVTAGTLAIAAPAKKVAGKQTAPKIDPPAEDPPPDHQPNEPAKENSPKQDPPQGPAKKSGK
jgi:hypothetical protein